MAHEITHVVQQSKDGRGPQLLQGRPADIQRKPGDEELAIATTEPIEEGRPMPGPEIEPSPITPTWLRGRSRQWLVDRQELLRSQIENIFELTTRDWALASATARGRGTLSFRVSADGRLVLLSDFDEYFMTEVLREGNFPEDLPPTVLTEQVLPCITITLEVTDQPAPPVIELPEGAAEAFALPGFDAHETTVGVLRAGGPVEVTARIDLQNGVSLGTITRVFYATPPSLEETTVERVLQYRDIVEEISSARGMDPSIVMAIISMETHGIAAGRSGEQLRPGYFGLMQARRIGIRRGAPIAGERRGREEYYPTREGFEEAVATYRGNIRQQIEDGVTAFLCAVRALRLPLPEASLSNEQIENDLVSEATTKRARRAIRYHFAAVTRRSVHMSGNGD